MLKTLGAQIREFKKDSLLTPVFMILEVFMETIIPLMMASIIDQGVEAGNIHHIYVMGAWMVVAACFSLFCGVMGGKYGARASAGFARNLRKAMYENIQSFSFSNIDKFSTAGLVTRLTTDVTNLQNAYQMLLRMCVRAPISLICAMCMAFFISPRLASIYLVAVIILGIILAIITVRAHHYFMEVFPKYDDLNASVQENVSAIRVVKAYVREDYEKNKFRKASQNIYNMFVKAESILAFNNPVMQITVYSCILAISWVGAKMIVGGTLTTGELMSLLTYCMNIMMSLMMLSMVFVMLAMSVASAERICEVLNEKSDITNPENADKTVPDGSITFDHVTFRYSKTSAKPVLSDIDLSIKSGETIGIIAEPEVPSPRSSTSSAASTMCPKAVFSSAEKTSVPTILTPSATRSLSYCRTTCSSPEPSMRICAGEMHMRPTKNAVTRADWHAPTNSSSVFRMVTTPTSSRAEPTSPAVRSSVCVLPARS